MLKRLSLLSAALVFTTGATWPTPDYSTDLGKDNTNNNTDIGGVNYDRCDTDTSAYNNGSSILDSLPLECHRWERVWGVIGEFIPSNGTSTHDAILFKDPAATPTYDHQQYDWAPEVAGADWRLPTIKELMRLYDYNNKSFSDPIIAKWLENLPVAADLVLISSSYYDADGDSQRDIEGDEQPSLANESQVYSLKVSDGTLLLLEPGYKDASTSKLQICGGLETNADATTCGTKRDVSVFALKVKK